METRSLTVHSHRSHAVPAALKPRKKPLQARSAATEEAIDEAAGVGFEIRLADDDEDARPPVVVA